MITHHKNTDKLKDIVNGRIVGIMSHGKSIEELENRIEEFRDYDICWTTLNLWTIMEDFILSKIDKRLEIILDCGTLTISPEKKLSYENNFRIPNFKKFIERKDNNLILSTGRLMETEYQTMGLNDFYKTYENKFLLLDYPLGILSVANSLTLLITAIGIGNPKKIILFGTDGWLGEGEDLISYYKPELQKQNRILFFDGEWRGSIRGNSVAFQNTFMPFYLEKCKEHNIIPPEIINCSEISVYTLFKKISYDSLKDIIKNG